MSIKSYLREIGRGKEGARSLSREQACDLMSQILDDKVNDLELGAFCLAMRVKGETEQEMVGFLDAAQARLNCFSVHTPYQGVVVLPSYNGARRLPVLTPLLALLLTRVGFSVLMHGAASEDARITSESVLAEMGIHAAVKVKALDKGEFVFVHTKTMSPALHRLLDIRRAIGLRNSAHSMVKLLNPIAHTADQTELPSALLVTSYTHPEYAQSMSRTLALRGSTALLLRGCEGEAVADLRRSPSYQTFLRGECITHQDADKGSVYPLPEPMPALSAQAIAEYSKRVLAGELAIPEPIKKQISLIEQLQKQSLQA